MKFIAIVLIIVGLIAVGAILSIFFLGLNSPVTAFLAPYLCGADKVLIVGDYEPSFDNTVPLACDDPESQFGTVPIQSQLIQFTLMAFIPLGVGLWLLQISSRWKAAGEWTAQNYGSGGGNEAELEAEIMDISAKLQRGEISRDEATRRIAQLSAKQ